MDKGHDIVEMVWIACPWLTWDEAERDARKMYPYAFQEDDVDDSRNSD